MIARAHAALVQLRFSIRRRAAALAAKQPQFAAHLSAVSHGFRTTTRRLQARC